jgi:group I intron endonuclease
MSIGIYKITNPKGRIYIGQSVRIEIRFKYYKRLDCKTHRSLYSSLLKYGHENHVFEIVELCDIGMLNEKERYYQDYYNVIGLSGLNCRLVSHGEKSGNLSAETIAKISIANTGKKRSKELVSLLALYNKMGIIGIKGTRHSEKTRQKMKDNNTRAMLGKNHNSEIRSIIKESALKMWQKRGVRLIFDPISGIYYDGIKEAAFAYGINTSTLTGSLNKNHKSKKYNHLMYV